MTKSAKAGVAQQVMIGNVDKRLTNTDGQDLSGKYVVIAASRLGKRYQFPQYQIFLASGGFGCSPIASGQKVFGTECYDGSEATWRRQDFVGIISEADAKMILSVKGVQPTPIDLSERVYMVVNCRSMSFHKDVTLSQALKIAKCRMGQKHVHVFRVHPEAYVNDMMGISAPSGTTIEEVK